MMRHLFRRNPPEIVLIGTLIAPKAGEVLVFRTSTALKPDHREKVRRLLKEKFGDGAAVLVLEGGLQLSAVQFEQPNTEGA